jgi:hypothetical protein
MNVSRINPRFRSSQWRQAFADCLIRLCPGINPDAADEASDSEFMDSADNPPDVAARRYALAKGLIAASAADRQDSDEDRGASAALGGG